MQALRLSEHKKAYYCHSAKPLSKQLKGITFFVKNTAKKDENFLMFMRKFPEPPLITFQFEKWALWFRSLPDFPGKLCHECFIHEDGDPSQHPWALALSSPRKAEVLKLEWAYPSIPSLVLRRARNLLLFFFQTNSCLVLTQVVHRPHFQKLWKVWICSHRPDTSVSLFD